MTATISERRDTAAGHAPDPDAWQDVEAKITAALDGLDDPDGLTSSAFYDLVKISLPAWARNEDTRNYTDVVLTQAAFKARIKSANAGTPADPTPIDAAVLYSEIMQEAVTARIEIDSATKSMKIDSAVQKVMTLFDVEMHGLDAAALHELLAAAAESEYSSIRLGADYMKFRGFRMTHLTGEGVANEFNCWTWIKTDGGAAHWTDETGNIVLAEITKLDSIDGFRPTARLATDITKQLSADPQTLRITFDVVYARALNSIVIDPQGRYYDIATGDVRDIDPTVQYYRAPDVKYEICSAKDDAAGAAVFVDFLKDRFGTSWEIVRDHLATIFLAGEALKSKPKMLEVVGAKDTYKSYLIEYVADMLDVSAVSAVSMKQLDNDNVFGPATIMNRRLNYSDETAPEMPRNQSQLKEVITAMYTPRRVMRSTKLRPAYRYPRWIVAANKMQPIGVNDDDDSMFVRMNIIETLAIPQDPTDWRSVLDAPDVRRAVMMYLLQRATEIHNDPDSMRVQDVETTRAEYDRLRTDDLTKYIDASFERVPEDEAEDVGVDLKKFWRDFQKAAKTNITRPELRDRLEVMGMTIADRMWAEPHIDRSRWTWTHSSNADVRKQKTLILGLKSVLRTGQEKIE